MASSKRRGSGYIDRMFYLFPELQIVACKGFLALAMEVVCVALCGHPIQQSFDSLIDLPFVHISVCDDM